MKSVVSSLLLAVVLTSCAHGGGSGDTGLPVATAASARVVVKQRGVLRVLHSFKGMHDGSLPVGPLVLWNDRLWGLTQSGGSTSTLSEGGTIFSYSLKDGKERVVYTFKGGADGSNPYSGLTLLNGIFYGTTAGSYGGGGGTIFSFAPATDTERVLHQFTASEGLYPTSLTADNGLLYGSGGAGGTGGTTGGIPPMGPCGGQGCGTVFSINPATDAFAVIHSFADSPDGANPQAPPIVLNGTLYGTTSRGGDPSYCATGICGTIYAIDIASGQERVVYSFSGDIDGESPQAALTFAHGRLYGTTTRGGSGDCEYGTGPCGTVFSFVPSSALERVVYRFGAFPDSSSPAAPLTVRDGKLYGAAQVGGIDDAGSIFSIDMKTREESVIYSFPRSSSQTIPNPLGKNPSSPLLFVHGTFYGTAEFGGPYPSENEGSGTLFSFTQ